MSNGVKTSQGHRILLGDSAELHRVGYHFSFTQRVVQELRCDALDELLGCFVGAGQTTVEACVGWRWVCAILAQDTHLHPKSWIRVQLSASLLDQSHIQSTKPPAGWPANEEFATMLHNEIPIFYRDLIEHRRNLLN